MEIAAAPVADAADGGASGTVDGIGPAGKTARRVRTRPPAPGFDLAAARRCDEISDMRLLASPHPTAGRFALSADGGFTLLLIGWLIGLELVGRWSTTDAQDGIAVAALGAAVAFIVARHRRRPLPWVSRLLARMSRISDRIERLKYDHGIDLRGAPPIRRGVPRAAWWLALGLAAWGFSAALAWTLFPNGWRDAAANTFYLGYLVIVAGMWFGLVACIAASVYAPVRLADSVLPRWLAKDGDRRGGEVAFLCAYALATVAIARFVPIVAILTLCLIVGAVALVAAARAGGAEPAILWRTGPGRRIRAVPLNRLLAGSVALAAGFAFCLLLTACGGQLFGGDNLPASMPATALIGSLAAWLAPGAAAIAGLKVYAGLRNDPARRLPPTLHASGNDPAAIMALTKAIRQWCWRVRPAAERGDPADVCVEIVPPERSEATEFEPVWPLKVAVADLTNPDVKDRLHRRDEIQLRRRISRGLSALFKRTAGEKKKHGGGYWFAPHWWFVDSIGREDKPEAGRDEPTLRPVGPPYSEVFGPRARQHLYRIFRATQVDMVFVECGIGHRAVDRVLRALYELYDIHGGKRKAEDHHFRGVPKVRVMIHDYAPGSRFKATGYKEPGFDELSRARVLHVFKDRGGHEELEDVPFDTSWEPAPALGVG